MAVGQIEIIEIIRLISTCAIYFLRWIFILSGDTSYNRFVVKKKIDRKKKIAQKVDKGNQPYIFYDFYGADGHF